MTRTNRELIRRWNQENADPDAVRELVSPDFVVHGAGGEIHGIDEWLAYMQRAGEDLRDAEAGIDELIEMGDLVGERWWIRGITADGRPTRLRGITMHRVADGRLEEDWVVFEQEQ